MATAHDKGPVGSAGNQIVVEGGCGLQHGLFLLVRASKKARGVSN
ncbi:hypothetical protein HP15_3148 [Marinobacter adhaerens HP15]|uniref:Uncharacterized protein n=1 Tax=Marinobacter adhaerens (strain DSM 23420 / HP15) TaxID=225937 RepID=E4PPN9_MARAH|nr:hypothetical protein HP15_3148 [Marinobacter adhaerens HP15]